MIQRFVYHEKQYNNGIILYLYFRTRAINVKTNKLKDSDISEEDTSIEYLYKEINVQFCI